MKIGILGGTFDPIHFGHLILSEWIRESLDLEKVIFIPAFIPPHKTEKIITPSSDRKSMILMAIKNNPCFQMSEYELEKKGISYSIDTIAYYRDRYGLGKSDLYFLIGSDSLHDFHTWHQPEKILSRCEVVVYHRPGYDVDAVESKWRNNVHIYNNPRIEISSTVIRERVALGLSIKYMLPSNVEKYIRDHSLYQKIP
jgi:nicotinate-nucleotide adenylyltransferase